MTQINFQPDEKILMKLRKHWFILLMMKIRAIGAAFMPFILFFVLLPFGVIPQEILNQGPLIIYAMALWLLIIVITLASIWTDYYLDLWIVTDRRIVNVNQIGLFRREVTTTRVERVQDATTRQMGFIATILNFGSIRVQTASEDASDTIIEGIPNPTLVRSTIMGLVDQFAERHMEEAHGVAHQEYSHDTHTT